MSAPASSANLGPGFDSLALALGLRNELVVEPGEGRVYVHGEGATSLPATGENLVARAFDSAAPGLRQGLDLHCHNHVPLARGLGSSTAAAAVGLVAGWETQRSPWDARRLFVELAGLDGHPDNAAACAFGGLVATVAGPREGEEPLAVPVPVPDWLSPVLVVPGRELATEEARAALPDRYDRHDVAHAVGAAATLVAALAAGDPHAAAATLQRDVVHEPHRARLVPELALARAVLEQAAEEALGATLSGAGPSVLVWATAAGAGTVTAMLQAQVAGCDVLQPGIELAGARIEASIAP